MLHKFKLNILISIIILNQYNILSSKYAFYVE